MEWSAVELSVRLAFWTCAILLPLAILTGRALAWSQFRGKAFIEAVIAVPLVLPPTVLGYYLLVSLGNTSSIGRLYESLTGHGLVFTFDGLLFASIIFNLPFAVQPMQRAFETVPMNVREAAWCSGLSNWITFWRIELPLAWTGIMSALVLTFAHTLGEFGVVLMMGGNIPEQTRTLSIAIYDRVQMFDYHSAGIMSAVLLGLSVLAIAFVYMLGHRRRRYHG